MRRAYSPCGPLCAGVTPNAARRPINLSLGEPKHPTPPLILEALAAGAKGLANYPTIAGPPALREAIAAWLSRRHALGTLDPATQVLPVLGSREALFAFGQTVIDASRVGATVVVPNPFYQIYEGAALLAGATPHCVNSLAENGYAPRWDEVPVSVWARTQLLYVCSPDNPTGRVMSMRDWQALFELSDRHDFIIAADECYSEVYFDEANPPLGSLAAARALGRDGYPRLLAFGSLSLGPRRGQRRRICAAPVRRGSIDRVTGKLSRARGRWRKPRPRLRSHRTGGRARRVRRSGRPAGPFRAQRLRNLRPVPPRMGPLCRSRPRPVAGSDLVRGGAYNRRC